MCKSDKGTLISLILFQQNTPSYASKTMDTKGIQHMSERRISKLVGGKQKHGSKEAKGRGEKKQWRLTRSWGGEQHLFRFP
jgi:hypothetical protein